MSNKLSISLLILFVSTFAVYGQQIQFQQNINSRASELIQRLNINGDSLLLESSTNQIRQVDVFNNDFAESITVNSNRTKIDLKTLPIGNFVIQAKIDQKWIVMYLEKNEDLKVAASNQNEIQTTIQHNAAKFEKVQNALYYWVVSESNSNFGSSKTMKLEYKEDIAKLISKHKLELKSGVGKDNKLHVYAVYNKSQFMTKQLRNPKYYKSAQQSKFFNTEPYYTSHSRIINGSKP